MLLEFMKKIFVVFYLLLIGPIANSEPLYETYIQANQVDESKEIDILVLVKGIPESESRMSMVKFNLSEGERYSSKRANKLNPNIIYKYDAIYKGNVLYVDVVVFEDENIIFESVQKFASWKGMGF
jgi:hypothetical protein